MPASITSTTGFEGNHTFGSTYGKVAFILNADSNLRLCGSCLLKKLQKSIPSGSPRTPLEVSGQFRIIKLTGRVEIIIFLPSIELVALNKISGIFALYSSST